MKTTTRRIERLLSPLGFALLLAGAAATAAQAQDAGGRRDQQTTGYSESADRAARSRTANRARPSAEERSPARILREARTIFIEPNPHIDSKYLEYKLGKFPEFQQWRLTLVKDCNKADLVLDIHKRALNYIFSIEDRASSAVVVNGKVVAINGLVAAEDISREIIKRIRAVRALPVTGETP